MVNKLLYAILLLTIFASCKSAQTFTKIKMLTPCEQEFDCEEEMFLNSAIDFKRGEYGNNEAVITKADGKYVVSIKRNRIVDAKIQDGRYREHFLFEFDGTKSSNKNSLTRFIFGKFCFCKGEAGYFEVKDYQVTFSSDGKTDYYSINYSVPESKIKEREIMFHVK